MRSVGLVAIGMKLQSPTARDALIGIGGGGTRNCWRENGTYGVGSGRIRG